MTAPEVQFLLHADVEAVPMPDQDEVLVARRGSRVPPQLISSDAMALLEHFREPSTLVDAILAYSADVGADPMATLDQSFGVLVALTRTDVLVADGTAPAHVLADRHRVGEVVGPATVTGRIRVLRDSEIWRGVLADGTRVVVKVVDDEVHGPGLVSRELAALHRLDGSVAPRLVWHERSSTGGTLVLDEVDGDSADLAALVADADGRRRIAAAVLDAYVALHERGVLHGDVHPGNVLVGGDSSVTLIDFGLAGTATEPPPRPGGGEYLDPAGAAALRTGTPTPALDAAAEQYAVAAVVYRLLTGAAPLDLACERDEALRRIAEDRPRPFVAVGATPWPTGERVLRRALSTDPERRYRSVRALRDAFAGAAVAPRTSAPDLGDALAALDVTGSVWATADDARAAHVAWFAGRVATLTGDPFAYDLALVWASRCGHVPPPAPDPRSPLARAHRALAAHALTGRPAFLRAARDVAAQLQAQAHAPEAVDVLTGGWAGLLLALECERPALALAPGTADG
ncbi:protein kinase domain-containing protein [Cellulomonas sp. P5_C5]